MGRGGGFGFWGVPRCRGEDGILNGGSVVTVLCRDGSVRVVVVPLTLNMKGIAVNPARQLIGTNGTFITRMPKSHKVQIYEPSETRDFGAE